MDEELRQVLTEQFGGANRRLDDANQRLADTEARVSRLERDR